MKDVCAVCRHRAVPPDRSVCEACVPRAADEPPSAVPRWLWDDPDFRRLYARDPVVCAHVCSFRIEASRRPAGADLQDLVARMLWEMAKSLADGRAKVTAKLIMLTRHQTRAFIAPVEGG